jgi:hypothetical protein
MNKNTKTTTAKKTTTTHTNDIKQANKNLIINQHISNKHNNNVDNISNNIAQTELVACSSSRRPADADS